MLMMTMATTKTMTITEPKKTMQITMAITKMLNCSTSRPTSVEGGVMMKEEEKEEEEEEEEEKEEEGGFERSAGPEGTDDLCLAVKKRI